MLKNLVTDARAWRANTIDACRSWYYPLSQRCLAALDDTLGKLRHEPRAPIEVNLAETPCAACSDEFQAARAALETGRGFIIVEGMEGKGYSSAEQQVVYWLVGQMLGQPMEQNVQGTLLYDVRDTGQDVRYGARFSVTNAETGFHTDNSFGEAVVDYVGLLCLQSAKSGGRNQLVSVYAIHNELLEKHPDLLETLYQPFHFERRAGLRPGEAPTVQFPIFSGDAGELVCRYLRYWIEAGHQTAEQSLTSAQSSALAALEQVFHDPKLSVEFGLRPADMLFTNNRWLLHNRSAFEDFPEPERRRHYIRLWLRRFSA